MIAYVTPPPSPKLTDGMLIADAIDSDEPIDWHCLGCRHTYSHHRDGKCHAGLINKCKCESFVIDGNEVKKAESELELLSSTLFKYYDEITGKKK